MKKFGTPTATGPGSARDIVGFCSVGTPFGKRSLRLLGAGALHLRDDAGDDVAGGVERTLACARDALLAAGRALAPGRNGAGWLLDRSGRPGRRHLGDRDRRGGRGRRVRRRDLLDAQDRQAEDRRQLDLIDRRVAADVDRDGLLDVADDRDDKRPLDGGRGDRERSRNRGDTPVATRAMSSLRLWCMCSCISPLEVFQVRDSRCACAAAYREMARSANPGCTTACEARIPLRAADGTLRTRRAARGAGRGAASRARAAQPPCASLRSPPNRLEDRSPMSDETESEGLRERLTKQSEDTFGRLAEDLLANPLVSGAIARAFEAREKATAAQEATFARAEHPDRGRHRAAHAPRALGLAAPGGHRGRHRPPRRAAVDARRRRRHRRAPGGDRGAARGARRASSPRCARRCPARRAGPGAPGADEGLGLSLTERASPTARPARPARRRATRPSRSPACTIPAPSRRRRTPSASKTSDTASRHATRDAAQLADPQERGGLHLDGQRTVLRPRAGARGVAVVEEVARRDGAGPRVLAPPPRAAPRRAPGRRRPARPRRAPGSCRQRQRRVGDDEIAELEVVRPARRRCRRGSPGSARDRTAPRARSPRSARPCRWPGSSAARRRRRCPCSPTGRGCG